MKQIDRITSQTWDYIIIGTGMGGGTAGLKLAQEGYQVLFVEQGQIPSLKGKFAEEFPGPESENFPRAGRWDEIIIDHSQDTIEKFLPLIGKGVGGSSALYGMVLERFDPQDFLNWPIGSEEMENYYQQAEALYQVRRQTSPRHSVNMRLFELLSKQGKNPYLLPMAKKKDSQCRGCQSFQCAFECKNHSGNIAVMKAVDHYGAHLITDCKATQIQWTHQDVDAVHVAFQGEKYKISCRGVILSAGALNSPILLQASKMVEASHLVGQNLMRHFVDLYVLRRSNVSIEDGSTKEIGVQISDEIYLQSFGEMPPTRLVLKDLEAQFPYLRLIRPLCEWFFNFLLQKRVVLASIIQDSPQTENKVWSDGEKICIHYEISQADRVVIHRSRKEIKKLLKPWRPLLIARAEKNSMLAHVCGTLKMGNDRKTSVVNKNNEVHGFRNLFVLDASFFPSSGRKNPALTIAANALRVADHIVKTSVTKRKIFNQN